MSEVATLEGLDGARSCLVVHPGKGGTCRCARFGPPGSGSDFKKLCKTAGLPIKIGGTSIEGETNMSRSLALPPPLDMGPMGDDDMMEGIFGIDGLIDPEMLRESVATAGGGAGAAVAWSLLVTKVAFADKDGVKKQFFDSALKRGGLAVVLGLVGGRALWNQSRDAAKGLIGAMGGVIGVEIATALLAKTSESGTHGLADAYDVEAEAALSSLSQTLPEEQALLEQVDIQERKRNSLMGMGQVQVTEPQFSSDLSSWIGA